MLLRIQIIYPLTTVEVGNLDGAKEIARKLKSQKFWDLCSDTALKRFEQNYTEEKWKENWRFTNGQQSYKFYTTKQKQPKVP